MQRAHRSPAKSARLAVWIAVALLTAGCGEEDPATGAGSLQSSTQDEALEQGDVVRAEGVAANDGDAPSLDRYQTRTQDDRPVVRINTSAGSIDIRLDPEAAPGTVRNFLNYVQSGHYEQTVFHYVESGQLILGGGFTADGAAKSDGVPIRNEAHNGRKNKRGTVAMARDASVIDSATSQFFINLQDAPHLDHSGETPDKYGYCVFGDVIEGLAIAAEISALPTETRVIDGVELIVPTRAVQIDSVKVLR